MKEIFADWTEDMEYYLDLMTTQLVNHSTRETNMAVLAVKDRYHKQITNREAYGLLKED